MIPVRKKDLALVAFAGGLLAFEVVSLGEALPGVKQALARHGVFAGATVAPISAASVTASALVQAGSTASQAAVGAVKGAAHLIATGADPNPSDRHARMTRDRSVPRVHKRLHIVTVGSDGSCTVRAVVPTLEQARDVEKAVELAVREATL